MRALPFLISALCLFVIAYRYYSGFLAAKVLSLEDSRITPAHRFKDGQNYHATPRWVLFGHHFAAITGAGPLIGPVLAAQFGFLPGFLWLVIGVVVAGAVHDFVILTASVRSGGQSIAQMAHSLLGPWAGRLMSLAVLFIVTIALAGLGLAVVNALQSSPWGTFTLACTVPIALLMGLYTGKMNPQGVRISTAFGVVSLLVALIIGKSFAQGPWASVFSLTRNQLIVALAVYGLIASVLPVWLLLCPRDYLSSYLKLGTIAALTVAVIIVNPELHLPMISSFAQGGGPIVPGKWYPFVFITIACGAISGFHSLIASGTTPKMIAAESDCRAIGYGAMLCEGWVGLTSLIAAAALFPEDYFAINVSPEKWNQLGMSVVHLPELAESVGESVAGRPGGAVSLAVGMAQVFSSVPGLKHMMAYGYHFAILFEALFILTTIDSGTRVARLLVQETFGKIHAPWGRPDHGLGTWVASVLVVVAWASLIWTGSISTLWPLFGVANQLLASLALVVASVWLIREKKARYLAVTLVPFGFVGTTTLIAGYQNMTQNFLPLVDQGKILLGYFNAGLVALMMTVLVLVCGFAGTQVLRQLRG
jgi:carbon starvation protein